MSSIEERISAIQNPSGPAEMVLRALYGSHPDVLHAKKDRLISLMRRYQAVFPVSGEVQVFSTPGRTEVGGNHTDHNAGRVLAAAVDLDVLAVAAKTGDGCIQVDSEGYPRVGVDIQSLDPAPEERFTSAALVRGICARFVQLGYRIGGFQAALTSDVPKGSGLSSSAAYEVAIGTILNHLYNEGRIDPVEIAKTAQFSENQYFGKPCGLMDQTTCAVGGFVSIDFKDAEYPAVHKVDYNFSTSGYALVITETGGDHADLNEEYASVAGEMKAVARTMGGQVLRDLDEDVLIEQLVRLRSSVGDRALLRAFHFFADNRRVEQQVTALEAGDFKRFLHLVNDSGISSWILNQNCYSIRKPAAQGIPLALHLSRLILGEEGASRVHGGGFAGTIQAFVPLHKLDEYLARVRAVFGETACYPVSIRSDGSIRLEF